VIKKYLPFIALIAAALFLYWVRSHQGKKTHSIVDDRGRIDAIEGFIRDTSNLVYSKHARCRMDCRNIDESEVKDILEHGKLNEKKIEEDDQGVSYPLEGFTSDDQHVRIVFAPHGNRTVVVTVIDLDKDWPCNCD